LAQGECCAGTQLRQQRSLQGIFGNAAAQAGEDAVTQFHHDTLRRHTAAHMSEVDQQRNLQDV
jgi:hypothetical protein